MVGDEVNGSSPSLFRVVAQQYVCAGNDHEGFCSVTETAEDSAQRPKQDPSSLCVFQKDPKPCEGCDAV